VLPPDACPILCDPHQLESAILNLCINARDAMPDGGRIIIETANALLDEERAPLHEVPAGRYVAITITDTGRGMSPAVLARAFDPFFTTKPSGQGTGLGLSMVYGFARQSGGQARIHSAVGEGTTVQLYLPQSEDKPGDYEEHESRPALVHVRGSEVALVVDDEPAIRMLLVVTLEKLGCHALEAANGVAALKILQSDARIDLLITDVRMPGGLNGPELVEQVRRLRPTLKVLFITGYAESGPIAGRQLGPGTHLLTKPFSIDSFTAKLDGLLGEPAQVR
jgi:CheY-like chemotaxis protein